MKKLIDYPIQVKLPISKDDMRGASHVRNTCYPNYFESARNQYLQEIGLIDLRVNLKIGEILARTICNYHKPLSYPDQIIVGAKLKSLGNTSFVLEYIVVSEKVGVAATGEEIIVVFDYNTMGKVQIPSVIKEGIVKVEARAEIT